MSKGVLYHAYVNSKSVFEAAKGARVTTDGLQVCTGAGIKFLNGSTMVGGMKEGDDMAGRREMKRSICEDFGMDVEG